MALKLSGGNLHFTQPPSKEEVAPVLEKKRNKNKHFLKILIFFGRPEQGGQIRRVYVFGCVDDQLHGVTLSVQVHGDERGEIRVHFELELGTGGSEVAGSADSTEDARHRRRTPGRSSESRWKR